MTVTRFKMGADVPEWLLTLEPRSAQSRKVNFRFMVDVDVIETDDVFVVVPCVFGHYAGMIDTSGVTDCELFAPGKPTRMAMQLMDTFARGMAPRMPFSGPVLQPPPIGVVERTDTHTVPVQAGPDPHRTFWARLRYAFTGH